MLKATARWASESRRASEEQAAGSAAKGQRTGEAEGEAAPEGLPQESAEVAAALVDGDKG